MWHFAQSFRGPYSLQRGRGHDVEPQRPLLDALYPGPEHSACGQKMGRKAQRELQKVCVGQDLAWKVQFVLTLYYPKLRHRVGAHLAGQAGKSDAAVCLGEERGKRSCGPG